MRAVVWSSDFHVWGTALDLDPYNRNSVMINISIAFFLSFISAVVHLYGAMTSKCERAPGYRLEWGSLVYLGFKQSWSHHALSHHHLLQYTAPMDYLHICCYLGRSHSAKEKPPAVYPYGDSGIVMVNLTTSYTQRWLLKWGR